MVLDQAEESLIGQPRGIEARAFWLGLAAAQAQQHDTISHFDEELTALRSCESSIETIEPTGVGMYKHGLAASEIVRMPALTDALDGQLARGAPKPVVVIGAGAFDGKEAVHVANPRTHAFPGERRCG